LATEEYDLLRRSVREFSQKTIEPVAVKIEQNGLGQETVDQMAAQGFMGARIPSEHGGSGLDELGYLIVLEELARCSPSAAARVLITNSLFAPLLLRSGSAPDLLGEVASGKTNATVSFAVALEGHGRGEGVTVAGSRAKGRLDFVLNANASLLVGPTAGADGKLLLLKGGFGPVEDYPRLGFKGLRFSAVQVDTGEFEVLADGGPKILDDCLGAMDLDVAAVSLGIASGALAKAVDYSRARSTFEHPLKDYEPIAFGLSLLRSEEEMLRGFLYAPNMPAEGRTMAKVRGMALARDATKQALQVHGGYGYFEDFGVEKFYRDAMALSILFGRSSKDLRRLSEAVYGSRAGFL